MNCLMGSLEVSVVDRNANRDIKDREMWKQKERMGVF